MKMSDKTSTIRTIYQGRGINFGRVFGRGRGYSYFRGRGHGFNLTKPNVQGNFEALGSDIYMIRDALQSDRYMKMAEAILNYIQGNVEKLTM